jgi:hypothetical protein
MVRDFLKRGKVEALKKRRFRRRRWYACTTDSTLVLLLIMRIILNRQTSTNVLLCAYAHTRIVQMYYYAPMRIPA